MGKPKTKPTTAPALTRVPRGLISYRRQSVGRHGSLGGGATRAYVHLDSRELRELGLPFPTSSYGPGRDGSLARLVKDYNLEIVD